MTMTDLAPGKPSPRFDATRPLVAPEHLTATCDLAGYPIAVLGHVRIFEDARIVCGTLRGFELDGPNAHYTDANLHAIEAAPDESGLVCYRVSPHTRVEGGRLVRLDMTARHVRRVPVNGSRTGPDAVTVGVARLVRPFETWQLPDHAQECMAERIAQGLYTVPDGLARRGGAQAWDRAEAAMLASLRADLETVYPCRGDTAARPPEQRDALWNHILARVGSEDRGAIAELYGAIAGILAIGERAWRARAAGEELSSYGTVF